MVCGSITGLRLVCRFRGGVPVRDSREAPGG